MNRILEIIIEKVKYIFKKDKAKYEKHPKTDSIFRPAKTWKQKDERWNLFHDFFKRGLFYPFLRKGLFYPFLRLVKKRFQKHDTWAHDGNIPKSHINEQFWVLRESYNNAFDIWLRSALYPSYQHRYPDYKKFRTEHYNSWAQKSIRWLIDFICLAGLEDTVYRELLAVWSFEHQKLMNKVFNPEINQHHVFYCSYYDGDQRYFELAKQLGKRRRMNPELHRDVDKLNTKINADYFMQKQKEFQDKKQEVKEQLMQKDITIKNPESWADVGKKLPDLIKHKDIILKKLPTLEEGEIAVLSIPNGSPQGLQQLNQIIGENHKGKGHFILIDKEFDLQVLTDIKRLVQEGKI